VATTFDVPSPGDSLPLNDVSTLEVMSKKLLGSIPAKHIPAIGFVKEEMLSKRGSAAMVPVIGCWPSGGVVLASQNALFRLKCVTQLTLSGLPAGKLGAILAVKKNSVAKV